MHDYASEERFSEEQRHFHPGDDFAFRIGDVGMLALLPSLLIAGGVWKCCGQRRSVCEEHDDGRVCVPDGRVSALERVGKVAVLV